jgi:PIN domain nuclease of toxin-antitoxin system
VFNLDTHILINALAGDLTTAERALLGSHRWSISAIVLWEIAKLAQLGRIELDLDDASVIRALGSIHIWPLTIEVARASTRLDIHSDPANELIAATSVVHKVPLLTRDRVLRRSRMIPLAHKV